MKFVPRSIHGRMLALSVVATLAALAIAAVAIGGVLERFVTGTIDARLEDRLIALESAIHPNGDLDRSLIERFAESNRPDEAWRIDSGGRVAGSGLDRPGIKIAFDDDPRLGPPIADPRRHGPSAPAREGDGRLFDEQMSAGPRVHGLIASIDTTRGEATVIVAVSRRLIERPIRGALLPLTLSLAAIGVVLAAATLVQLRLGLRPLRALRDRVAAIRAGTAATVPTDQPYELRPLAVELNALVADNAAALGTARASAANLAHGLKTPVATLGLALAAPGRDPDGTLAAQLARIDAVIRHHLARARSAVADTRTATRLAPALADLAAAIARLHADRGVAIERDVPDLAVMIGAQDLDELAGNLIENAVRHARTRVTVTAVADGRLVRLSVADDGPGIPAAARARAVEPGHRLDERGDGHGFGLAIAREIAALHGGALTLDEAPGGGLLAAVTLPKGHVA